MATNLLVEDGTKKRQFVLSILECAGSFYSWIIKKYVTGFNDSPASQQDEARTRRLFGWLSNEHENLNEAWAEWFTGRKNPHFEKNVLVEYAKTDVQRATKLLSFTTVAGTGLGYVLGALTVGLVWAAVSASFTVLLGVVILTSAIVGALALVLK